MQTNSAFPDALSMKTEVHDMAVLPISPAGLGKCDRQADDEQRILASAITGDPGGCPRCSKAAGLWGKFDPVHMFRWTGDRVLWEHIGLPGRGGCRKASCCSGEFSKSVACYEMSSDAWKGSDSGFSTSLWFPRLWIQSHAVCPHQ